jgi:hypothetical protein
LADVREVNYAAKQKLKILPHSLRRYYPDQVPRDLRKTGVSAA